MRSIWVNSKSLRYVVLFACTIDVVSCQTTVNRRNCQSETLNTASSNPTQAFTCTIGQQLYVRDFTDIFNAARQLNPSLFSDVYIFGVMNLLATRQLFDLGVGTNATAQTYDEFTNYVSSISMELTSGAVARAIREFCDNQPTAMRINITVHIIYVNDGCDVTVGAKQGVSNGIEMVDGGVDAFFGFPCSDVTIHAAYYIVQNNRPIFSYDSSNSELDDKNVYNTLVRLGPVINYQTRAILEVLRQYRWRTIYVLVDEGHCEDSGASLKTSLDNNPNFTAVEFNIISSDRTDDEIRLYLEQFAERSRVLVACLASGLLRRVMKLAEDEDRTNEEFVYIVINRIESEVVMRPWGPTNGMSDGQIEDLLRPYMNVKIITVAGLNDRASISLMEEITQDSADEPFRINNLNQIVKIDTSIFALYLYDCVSIYLELLRTGTRNNQNVRSGRMISTMARNMQFDGRSGTVKTDDLGDRQPVYWLWQLNSDATQFTQFATIDTSLADGEKLAIISPVVWLTANGMPPPDVPMCGYRGELCAGSTLARNAAIIAVFGGVTLVSVVIFASLLVYRKRKFEQDLQKMTWKLNCTEIEFASKHVGGNLQSAFKSTKSDTISRSLGSKSSMNTMSQDLEQQVFTKVGYYKGMICAVKAIKKTDCKLQRKDLVELKQMKDLHHENVNSFVGACIDDPYVYILTDYCSRGSLQDILETDEINLDWTFKCSLIYDLVNGLAYIHNSPIVSHGYLKSANCLIDNRWVLRIENAGLHSLKHTFVEKQEVEAYILYRDKLWDAPEILRMEEDRLIAGTQKADIYSCGIILQEILFRALPYFMDTSPQEIVEKVKNESDPPYRPMLPQLDSDTDPKMITLMQECWEEQPDKRPDIKHVKKRLIHINKGRKINILDNMVQKLERYANNLEEIVEKRTEELIHEKEKTDLLLYRMLPSVVAEKLKNGETVEAEVFENVTVYFSDVIGFTEIVSLSTPIQVVDLLNDLYTIFDDIIEMHNVYKVETIGDAYMVVSGCPIRIGDRHAQECADMSVVLRKNVREFKIRHMPDRPLMIRIGLHSGPIAAGVVGLTMPRYTLFGDTVNVASRMETSGGDMKIHISEECYNILSATPDKYIFTSRGQVDIKGKGKCTTYWLDEKDPNAVMRIRKGYGQKKMLDMFSMFERKGDSESRRTDGSVELVSGNDSATGTVGFSSMQKKNAELKELQTTKRKRTSDEPLSFHSDNSDKTMPSMKTQNTMKRRESVYQKQNITTENELASTSKKKKKERATSPEDEEPKKKSHKKKDSHSKPSKSDNKDSFSSIA